MKQKWVEVLPSLVSLRFEFRVCDLRRRLLPRLLILVTLAGCFPNEGPTSYEPPRIKEDTRDYPGITKEQALNASEKIFQLADGTEMKIKRGSSRLDAKRPHESLVYKSSWERWKVEAREADGSTYVTVSAAFDKEGSKVYPRGIGIYNLFFSRLDYMLGASKDWMTCEQYAARLRLDTTWGHENRFLCNDADDKVPEGPLN